MLFRSVSPGPRNSLLIFRHPMSRSYFFPADGRLSERSTACGFSSCKSVTDTDHSKRKSGRSGGSGLFPAIKTALVDVCHEIEMWHTMILKSYGELGLGRSAQGPTRTKMLSQNSKSREFCVPSTDPHTFGRPLPAGQSSMILSSKIGRASCRERV